MTAPQPLPQDPGNMSAQILLKLGEISAQLAAVNEQLKDIPDHEQRIRALERVRYRVAGVASAGGALAGGAAYWAGHLIR